MNDMKITVQYIAVLS